MELIFIDASELAERKEVTDLKRKFEECKIRIRKERIEAKEKKEEEEEKEVKVKVQVQAKEKKENDPDFKQIPFSSGDIEEDIGGIESIRG